MTHWQQETPEPAGPEAFRGAQSWALGFAFLLFAYAAVGGVVGVLWLIDLVSRLVSGPPPGRPFITAASVNLLFAPIAMVGAVLAIGCSSAASDACGWHKPGDLERASIALKRLRRWAGVAVATLIAFLACMAVAAVLTGEFPG